jgi:hypothetical protein
MSLPLEYTSPIVHCSQCDDDLRHCHGTAIVFDDYSHVCSDDPDCTASVDEHWFMTLADN